MTTLAWTLLAITLAVAVVDWWATETKRTTVRYVTKPLTMVVLIAMVLALEPTDDAVRPWFLIALVLSLAGDVFLMLPKDMFIAGLASFLLGHIAYVAGMLVVFESLPMLGIGLVLVALALAALAPRLLPAAEAQDPKLVPPVIAYIAVISAMVLAAFATTIPLAIVGALLFYSSDATLAWNRFVEVRRWGPLAVMVTYHLGQVGLALSLVG